MPDRRARGTPDRLAAQAAGRGSGVGIKRRFNERARCASLVARVCLLALAGCAGIPPATGPERDPLDRPGAPQAVAVVAARYAPEAALVAADSAVAGGALSGGWLGWQLGAGAIAAGPIGLAFAAGAMLAGTAIGATTGVVVDAITHPTDAEIVAMQSLAADRVAELRLSEATARVATESIERFTPYRVAMPKDVGPSTPSDRPDYTGLARAGFGAVVEIRVAKAGFVQDPARKAAFFVAADARLIDPASGRPTWLRGIVHLGRYRSQPEWLEGGVALVQREADVAQRLLGERIVEDLLLHTETISSLFPRVCGLRPVLPPVATTWTPPGTGAPTDDSVSRTPHLVWQPLPTAEGSYAIVPWARASERRYDLRIWTLEDGRRGDIVYERDGLTAPEHDVERVLDARTGYAWSVRLRYTLDGRPRATRWGVLNLQYEVMPAGLAPLQYQAQLVEGVPTSLPCDRTRLNPCGCLDQTPVRHHFTLTTGMR